MSRGEAKKVRQAMMMQSEECNIYHYDRYSLECGMLFHLAHAGYLTAKWSKSEAFVDTNFIHTSERAILRNDFL